MAEEEREAGVGGAVLRVVSSSEEQERLLVWLDSVTELSDDKVFPEKDPANCQLSTFILFLLNWQYYLTMMIFILQLTFLHEGLFVLIEVKGLSYKEQCILSKDCKLQSYSFATRRQIHVSD